LRNESAASAHPGYTPPQATNLLYAGEHFDADNQNYNLRARWYNPLNGLFNRMDDHPGNMQDPQSLHKYLYCHANPVNAIDPTGMFSLVQMVNVSMIVGCLSAMIGGEIARIKSGTVEQIRSAQAKWFWRGFAAGAIVYGGIWASHSILVALFGTGAGFGNLQYAEEYGISSYRLLRNQIAGTGLNAHHIIPGRFDSLLGLNYNNMLCVAVDPIFEHPGFTSQWQNYIPYGTTNVTFQQIWMYAQRIYANYPALLEAAKAQLLNAGAKI